MQARRKITVVGALPEDRATELMGYHGATKRIFDEMAAHGVDFRRTGGNIGRAAESSDVNHFLVRRSVE